MVERYPDKIEVGGSIPPTRTRIGLPYFIAYTNNDSLHTLTKIETGATPDPRIETLKKIAKGLNVSVDDLLKK